MASLSDCVLPCRTCGTEVRVSAWKAAHGLGKYCSNPCRLVGLNSKPRSHIAGFHGPYITRTGYVRGIAWNGSEVRNVLEHRWAMEQHLGRELKPNERVHHINGDRLDNRPENLCLYGSHSEHLHAAHRSVKPFVPGACEVCGMPTGPYVKPKSKARRFCSRRCAIAHRNRVVAKGKLTKECLYCGTEFSYWPSRPNPSFCSQKCSGDYRKDHPRWSRSFDACIECGATKTEHASKGLCANCYMRQFKRRRSAERARLPKAPRPERERDALGRWVPKEG